VNTIEDKNKDLNSSSPNKFQNDNYEKCIIYNLHYLDHQHLMEKITFLNYKVTEYKTEKEKLSKILNETKSDKMIYAEKLESEIKSYKKMIESCVKTCSQLAEEIMTLKKEIEKYTSSSATTNYSTSSTGFNNYNSNSSKNLSETKSIRKVSKLSTNSNIRNVSPIMKKMKI
jgi:hypothetical protein